MQMKHGTRVGRFNPAVLPMEYMPRITDAADEEHAKHYLIPGKVFVTAEPTAITTILGSGVTLCLYDAQKGVGGANHFTVPAGADHSNGALLRQLLELGANRSNLEGKIFGGSQPQITFGNSSEWLGNRNVEAALNFLGTNGIRLAEKEVGGTRGRKLIFQTDDGRCWSQQL